MASVGYAVDLSKAKLYPDKNGTIADFQPISKFCGTKPIKVALSDGWGGNYWRHITRAEFEDEASKCKNITETRYTDGEFKPEKQIGDIEGLIAQKYDVIVAFLDTGPAILKATSEATEAGVAVVPYSVGDNFPGKIGKDYVDRVTESQAKVGEQAAEWLVKTLQRQGQHHHVRRHAGQSDDGGANHRLAAVFAKYPGIKVLEAEPVPTMWDPAVAQQKTAALIAKYPRDRRHLQRDRRPDPRLRRRRQAAPGLCRSVADGSELPCRRASGDEDVEHRRSHLDGADCAAQGGGGRRRHRQCRAEPDHAADQRGHHLQGSEAGARSATSRCRWIRSRRRC